LNKGKGKVVPVLN